MENAIVKFEPRGIELYSRISNPLEAISQMGTFFAKSGMFGCERVEQGMVLAMECLATNRPPSAIARTYHIMDGKMSKKALAALAEFRSIGGKHRWVKDGTDGQEAALELTLDGNTITSRFTLDDAKRMGAQFKSQKGNDTNWTKATANMLRARAISNGVAMMAPEIYAGDIEDDPEPRVSEPLLPTKTEAASTATAEVRHVAATETAEVVDAVPVVTPVAFSPADAAVDENGRLTAATQLGLAAAIGEKNQDLALKWLIAKKWLTDGQNLGALKLESARKILSSPEKFISAIGGTK